jgi:CRISPR-associated protein Cmr3
MKTFFIEALDTLFFRDGRPFEVGGEANLMIPPSPSTFYGALRSAIIVSHSGGISAFKEGKDRLLTEWVGRWKDSEGKTAKLEIKGPLFAQKKDGNFVRYFPLPRDILVFSERKGLDGSAKQFLVPTKLKPAESEVRSNVPLSHLLVNSYAETCEYKPLLISERLFCKYLLGKLDEPLEFEFTHDVLPSEHFYLTDRRVGIGLKLNQKNVEKGRLFIQQHMVLRRDHHVQTGFVVECQVPEWFAPNGILRLGGDGKVAAFGEIEYEKIINVEELQKRIDETGLFKVYLATPALFEMGDRSRSFHNGYVEDMPGLEFELIAAAIGRPEMYGGYDIVANVPKVSFPAVPAGSVFYFRLKKGTAADVIKAFHNTCISDFRVKQGFGYSFVGGLDHV